MRASSVLVLNPPTAQAAPGWITGYTALDLRIHDASSNIPPRVHTAWLDHVAAGAQTCLHCGRSLAFGGRAQPLLLGAITLEFEPPELWLAAFCARCCGRFCGPEPAFGAMCAMLEGYFSHDRLFR